MLTARLRLADRHEPIEVVGQRVAFGGSFVTAFASRFVEISASRTVGCTEVWVGECADPDLIDRARPAIDRYRRFALGEGIKIVLHHCEGDGDGAIEVARTAAGGCPVYVAEADDGSVVLSWRFEDAATVLPHRRPDVAICREYLKHGSRPRRAQVLAGVQMLFPGELLRCDARGLDFQEVDDPQIALPTPLRDDARATDAFIDAIAAVIAPNLERAVNPLVEVSGGYDSSCVAIAARQVRPDLNAYGVIHRGAIGQQQRRRRAEIVRLLDLNDHEAPSYEPGPFASLEVEECSRTPLDDIYRLPCIYGVDTHPNGPFDLVLTGIGGDELIKDRTFRRGEFDVRGHASASAIDAAAGRADMFMRRGIWLSQPLVNPAVVDLCRALPSKLRSGRLLNILSLARAGLSDGYLFPRYFEHYGNVILAEAALLDFDALLSTSVVADFGIVDVSSMLARARDATRDGLQLELIVELWLLLKLEVILRRYVA